jgi:predicted ribosome quality control (RQC) complex YloA/Tae2 family protein
MVNFRELITKRGTLVLAGKDEKNNEELVAQVGADEEVFHTVAVGSPFVNIKGKLKLGDARQAAIFCARYSKDWRDNRGNVLVHRFKGKDIYKSKGMKTGTFGVRNTKAIKVKKKWILGFGE